MTLLLSANVFFAVSWALHGEWGWFALHVVLFVLSLAAMVREGQP